MALDDLILLGRQGAGLGQYLRWDLELADVVQLRGHADRLNVRLLQMIAVGLLGKPLQKQPRRKADVRHMRAVLRAVGFHRMAQDGHEQLVVFLLLVETLGHDAHQLLFFRMQQGGVDDAPPHHARNEGAAHVVRRAELEGLVDIGAARLRRDHDDRHLFDKARLIHVGQHLKAVHLRHHDVQQQHLEPRQPLFRPTPQGC